MGNTNIRQYDYIIAGAGAAGLSLAYYLAKSAINDSKVLIVDRDFSPLADKTWCFWHPGEPPLQPLIKKSWKKIRVAYRESVRQQQLGHHTYACIASQTFQRELLQFIEENSSFELLKAPADRFENTADSAVLIADGKAYSASYIFQSCFPPRHDPGQVHYPLVQHFLGWDLSADVNLFDPNTLTLMDFDEQFGEGIAFMYVLPWSQRKALLEYTIFSPEPLPHSFYEHKIENYLETRYQIPVSRCRINRREYGEIPMELRPYRAWYAPRVMNLGVSGGLTKPTTGYTFSRLMDHTRAIASALEAGEPPPIPYRQPKRFSMYDLWLLEMIQNRPDEALRVFKTLFRNNSMDLIFRFLSEQTTLSEDLKIMGSVPPVPFFKSIWKTRTVMKDLLSSSE
ncbi:MAG: lycopene cyclase family protein [Balneolaceae bacterium]